MLSSNLKVDSHIDTLIDSYTNKLHFPAIVLFKCLCGLKKNVYMVFIAKINPVQIC